MPFFKRKTDTKSKEFYQLHELPLPSNIPIETEIQNQKGKEGAPFDATKRAYEAFGLGLDVSYTIKDGKILIGTMAYSKDEASKVIEKNREAIKKALNLELK
jgi:hypothetical protein